MKQLRTYITRLTVAVLVWTGFSLYMVQPGQADRTSQSFANWLDKMAESSDGAELQKKLDDLRGSVNDLDDAIEEASKIASRYNENIDFSFAGSITSPHLYQLFIEWSHSQSGNTMDSVPVQHISKLIVSATVDKSGVGGFISDKIKTSDTHFSINSQLLDGQQLVSGVLIPMVNSIAIGAP